MVASHINTHTHLPACSVQHDSSTSEILMLNSHSERQGELRGGKYTKTLTSLGAGHIVKAFAVSQLCKDI